MPNSSSSLDVSLHHPPGLSSFRDVSDTSTSYSGANGAEEEHTLTAFGDISLPEEQLRCPEIRQHNRLRLKVKRPLLPKKRDSGQGSPMSPTSSSPSYAALVDALISTPRSNERLAARCSRSDSVESELTDPLDAIIAEPTPFWTCSEFPSPISSASSVSCKSGHSMIVKEVPSVAEILEQPKGWKKLPPRLPIPKWDDEL